MPLYSVRHAVWQDDQAALSAVRRLVFILEQRVPEELEWDEADVSALHALAEDDDGHAIGTGRLLSDGHIGRMAVLREWRGHGVGAAILDALIVAARERGLGEAVLNAQTHALGFYERRGFIAEGTEFQDAGIPHRLMRLRL